MPKSKTSVLFSPWLCSLTLLMLLLSLAALGQQASIVPPLVNFKGILTDVNGKPLTGTVGVTFYLYKDSEGGAPLWMETQNVQPDKSGRYTVSLGATTSTGLPTDVFVSGEARWLGVQSEGQAEQPRVLLLSVPYALKAGDAETIGGLPASAFVLANGSQGASSVKGASTPASAGAHKNTAPPANPDVTGKGVVDYIPMWNTTSDIVDSLIFQKTSEIGINTITPAATLDVNGKSDIRDTLTLFPKGTDSTLDIHGTAFKIDHTGMMTFISGQTFPGTGDGTITGVTAGTDLTGGGTSGKVTLNLDTTKVPQLNTANTFTQLLTALNGVFGTSSSGTGVYGTSTTGYGAAGVSTAGGTGVSGTAPAGGTGVYGENQSTSVGGDGMLGVAHTSSGNGVHGINDVSTAVGVYGENSATNGYGVYGHAPNGYGMATDSNATQARSMGGWVKAMVYISPLGTGIQRCFNSQLPGSQATTVPCGFTFTYSAVGQYIVDFKFKVDDRFPQVSLEGVNDGTGVETCLDDVCGGAGPTQVFVFVYNGSTNTDCPFFLTVF